MTRGLRSGNAFHRTDGVYIDQSRQMVQKAEVDGRIATGDAAMISQFIAEISAAGRGICPSRRYKTTVHLCGLRQWLPPFQEATYADLLGAVEAIKTETKEDGMPRYKQNTQADIIRTLRRFFLWAADEGFSIIPHDKIEKKIRPPPYQRVTKTAEQLLSEDEIRAMIEAARTPKDRAMISLLYESGCRIGEVATLKWEDVEFNDWNAAIQTDKKTGIPRYIPLIMSRGYLSDWRAAYPGKPEGQNLVFVTDSGHRPLQYAGTVKQLKIIARRAGITKKISPHLFRHSRITHLVQQNVNESVIKLMMWGHLDTDMLKTYLHLRRRDIDKAMAGLAGVDAPEEGRGSTALEPRQCPRCHRVWGPTIDYCGACGCELTEKATDERTIMRAEIKKFLALVKENPQMASDLLEEMS